MPDHEAHDYAERIRERLPRRLQELREAAGMSKYALAKKSGVSRDMISRVEGGDAEPHPARFRRTASPGAAVGG